VSAWTNDVVDADALTRPDLLAGRNTRSVAMPQLGRALLDTEAPLKAIVMIGVNAMVSVPETELVRQGLLRNDLFTVVHDQFITDTAKYADIVLPATTQIEATDAVTSWGSLHVGWNDAAIAPMGEAVSNSELHRRLAAAMGFTEPALFDDDITALRAALPTIDFDALRDSGVADVPYAPDRLPYANGGFATPSGKVALRSDALAALGFPALPTYLAPHEAPSAEFPFALLTPKQQTRFLNSSYSQLPQHGPLESPPALEVCAADADALGLAEGDMARVHNHRAELHLPVRITERVRPGVVSVPWGWWSHQYGGADGTVVNSLTSDAATDWCGGVAFWDTAVAVARA